MGTADLFEVAEDAAVELEGVDALLTQVEGGLLAPDSAGAVAHDRLASKIGRCCGRGIRKLGESLETPVEGTGERAVVDFERVARVEYHDLTTVVVAPPIEPAPQCGGIHCRGAPGLRADHGVVHADDLALYLHEHAPERLARRPALLRGELREPGVVPQPVDESAHFGRVTGEKEVDALFREEDGPPQPGRNGALAQQRAQTVGVLDAGEQIRRDVENGCHGLQPTRGRHVPPGPLPRRVSGVKGLASAR